MQGVSVDVEFKKEPFLPQAWRIRRDRHFTGWKPPRNVEARATQSLAHPRIGP